MDDRQYTFREGMTVYGAEGDKVGKIVAVDSAYVVVEKGFFFPTDYYIPTSAIANVDGDNIYLTVTKDQALNQAWDRPPVAGYAATAAYDEGTVDVETTDRVRVPVHEEELVASKRPVEAGTVRIEKDVITEERTLEVPVTEERVRVSQVAVDRDAPADDATAFQEGVIEVPLRTEEVDLQKRARVTGEVVVEKEATQRTERVGGAVRREEVRVEDETVAGAEVVDGAGRGPAR